MTADNLGTCKPYLGDREGQNYIEAFRALIRRSEIKKCNVDATLPVAEELLDLTEEANEELKAMSDCYGRLGFDEL